MPKTEAPLKIGFVFDDSLDSNDGVAQYVKTLGKWMDAQGHQVRYLVGETKLQSWAGGHVYSLSRNQKVIFNGNRLSIPFPTKLKKIKQVLREENFDVLHVQMPHSPFMAQRVVNAATKDTLVVGTFHVIPANWLASFGSRLLKLSYGWGLKKFSQIYSVSKPAASFAKSTYKIQSKVLPNVVEFERFNKAKLTWQNNDKPKIVFLGRLVHRKGTAKLLEAFAKAAGINAELIIAGDGPLRPKLENFTKENQLSDRVKFLGYINEQDKPGLLAAADIACFPAFGGESFGIVLIEAMAAGSGVVIGGNNPGYSSVLENNKDVVFDPNDTDKLAKMLLKLLDDRQLAKSLHQWQSKHVKQYDVNIVGHQLIEDYRSLIAKHRSSRHN